MTTRSPWPCSTIIFYIKDFKLPCVPVEQSNEIGSKHLPKATVLFHVPSEYLRLYGIKEIAKLEFIM